MSVLPILFNNNMVRALLEGQKTVTRRAIKPQPPATAHVAKTGYSWGWSWWEDGDSHEIKPPYCPGDILYVRETWAKIFALGKPYFIFKADDLDGDMGRKRTIWRPSIHMPKEAARIFLRVKSVRAERLQEITEEQAREEGAIRATISCDPENTQDDERTWHEVASAMPNFIYLWDSTVKPKDLNKHGWDANPWVWVIEFERTERPENWPEVRT